jgi:uncharacterized cupin superfamily protein
MPRLEGVGSITKSRGVRVISFNGPETPWTEASPLPNDQTPAEVGPGEVAVIYESEDRRVLVGLWRRDQDFGELFAEGQAIEVVLNGGVEITETDGTVHTVGSEDVMIYSDEDTGTWKQDGPIEKVFVYIRD